MFGRPDGVLGALGGRIMARGNDDVAEWVLALLGVESDDHVLDIGCGPGVGVRRTAEVVSDGFVAGIDPSETMVRQARKRNAAAIRDGRVEIGRGVAGDVPYTADLFDCALSINSMQVWPDAVTGLRELGRVVKSGGRVALAFTPHARQPRDELPELLESAGFERIRLEAGDTAICALASA